MEIGDGFSTVTSRRLSLGEWGTWGSECRSRRTTSSTTPWADCRVLMASLWGSPSNEQPLMQMIWSLRFKRPSLQVRKVIMYLIEQLDLLLARDTLSVLKHFPLNKFHKYITLTLSDIPRLIFESTHLPTGLYEYYSTPYMYVPHPLHVYTSYNTHYQHRHT